METCSKPKRQTLWVHTHAIHRCRGREQKDANKTQHSPGRDKSQLYGYGPLHTHQPPAYSCQTIARFGHMDSKSIERFECSKKLRRMRASNPTADEPPSQYVCCLSPANCKRGHVAAPKNFRNLKVHRSPRIAGGGVFWEKKAGSK